MKHSIKFKIVLSFTLLIVALLVGQIAFNLLFSKEYYVSKNLSEVEALYESIVEGYSDTTEILYDLTSEADLVGGYSVIVFSESKLIYSSRNTENLYNQVIMQGMSLLGDLDSYSENPVAEEVDLHKDSEQDEIRLLGKFEYDGEYRYIAITKPLQSINESIYLFTNSSIIIALVILIMGTGIIMLIARGLSKPIKDIEVASKNLANLDFSYEANEDASTLEMQNLAKSVNSMSRNLDSFMTQLTTANLKLQEDIEYQKNIEQSRKDFIANISHEMKTPLALLQIYGENLKNNVEGIDREKYCQTILEETERLDGIVKNMLNISAIENGLYKTKKDVFDFSQTAKNTAKNLSPLLEDFNVVLDITPQIKIYGDEKQIEEAMRNYINNAISHTKDGGTIKISLNISGRKAVFAVYNDGENISDTDLENIWESFYKIDKSRTRSGNGNAGLGLYIIRLIMNNHEGEYFINNMLQGVEFGFSITVLS